MSDDEAALPRHIIKRTLTITTTETWTVTVRPTLEGENRPTELDRSPDLIDQPNDPFSQATQGSNHET